MMREGRTRWWYRYVVTEKPYVCRGKQLIFVTQLILIILILLSYATLRNIWFGELIKSFMPFKSFMWKMWYCSRTDASFYVILAIIIKKLKMFVMIDVMCDVRHPDRCCPNCPNLNQIIVRLTIIHLVMSNRRTVVYKANRKCSMHQIH